MSARTCRRVRLKLKHDPRYNKQTRKDSAARDRRNRAKWEAEKIRAQRKKK